MSTSLWRWSVLCFVLVSLAAEPRVDRYGDPLPPHAVARLGTLRLCPGQPVDTFAIAPDGKTLATAEPWKVRLWDLKTGRERHAVEVGGDFTFGLQFAPDGRTLLIETDYYGRTPSRPPGNSYVLSVVSVEGGKLLWKTRAYDSETNDDKDGPVLLKSLGDRVLSTAGFLADGRVIFTLLKDTDAGKQGVTLWDAATGKVLHEFPNVTCCAASPDGKTLAGGTADGGIKLWDAATHKEGPTIQAHPCAIRYLAFSPDSKTLASSAQEPEQKQDAPKTTEKSDTAVRLWDPATGKERGACKGHELPAQRLEFSADGKTLVAEHMRAKFEADGRPWYRNELVVWDVETGKVRKRFPAAQSHYFSWQLTPDGKTLYRAAVAIEAEATLERWDLTADRAAPPWVTKSTDFKNFEFSRDGKLLVVRTDHLSLFDVESGKELHVYEAHHRPIEEVVFSPDGRAAATLDDSALLRAWDARTGAPLPIPTDGRQNRVIRFGFVGNDALLAVGLDGIARVWELPSGRERRAFKVAGEGVRKNWQEMARYPLSFRDPAVGMEHGVALTPDRRRLAVVDEKDRLAVWDVATAKQLATLDGHHDGDAPLAFSPDSRYLAAANHANVLSIWELPEGKLVEQFRGGRAERWCFGFSPDGRRFAWSAGKLVSVWDLAAKKEVRRVEGAGQFAFDEGGDVLATGMHADGSVRLTDVRTGRVLRQLSGNGGRDKFDDVEFGVTAGRVWAALSPRTKGHEWSVFDAASGRRLVNYSRDTSFLAMSPDGRTFAWEEGFIETATGGALGDLRREHRGYLTAQLFSPDSRRFATASTDGTVLIWDWAEARGLRVQAAGRLDAEKRDWFWTDLTAEDAVRAQRAVHAFAADADSVTFLKDKLRPADPADADRLAKMLKYLDDDSPDTRERTARDLLERGRDIEPLLRRALDRKPSAEMKRRIEEMLDSPALQRWSPESLRTIRAVQILEQIDTPEARRLLDELAKGAPEALLTQEATAARNRLTQRSPR